MASDRALEASRREWAACSAVRRLRTPTALAPASDYLVVERQLL